MGKYLSKDDFLKGIVGAEEDFDIPGVGVIRIRPLGMLEAMRISESTENAAERAAMLLSAAIVEPQLDESAAMAFYKASGEVINPLLQRIGSLAGNSTPDSDPLAGGGS